MWIYFVIKRSWFNYLGDNNAATLMINNLNKGIVLVTMRDDYINLCIELNNFYENPRHKRNAILKYEYFSTHWRTASTVVAIYYSSVPHSYTNNIFYQPSGKG